MSVHSNRSSVSRRPVGGQMNIAPAQPSSPVPSHISRTTSVSSEPILHETWVGPDMQFRPANSTSTPMTAPDPSFNVQQQSGTMQMNVSTYEHVETEAPPEVQNNQAQPMNASFALPANIGASWEQPASSEPNTGHSTLEAVPEAYFNNFASPESNVAPVAAEPYQNQPQNNLPSTGWAIAAPESSPNQPTPEHLANLQPRSQSTVSSTGWATATPEPVQQHNLSFQYPPSDDLSPLSLPGQSASPVPQPLFSPVASPSSASSPMTTPSLSSVQPNRRSSVATNPSARMPSNARPPVLNYNQQRTVESTSFASACCQCSNAIMYNTYYYNCTYCKLDICGTCFQAGKHPWTHLPSMVRLNAKETKAGDRREDKRCDNCENMKHRRMDCDECPYSICLSCYSNAAVPVHQHKSYELKATPGLTMSVRRGDGSPCCTKPSFGHCGRCYSPWKSDEWMVQCKTCLFEFEEVVAICLQCDSEILSACRQSQHQLVSMKCRQKPRNEQGGSQSNASVECTECANQFQSMTDISFLRHPHTNYDFLFITEDREHLFAAVYRSCKKKSPRTDTPLAPTANTTKCSYCHHNFPHEALHTCVPCKNVKYCNHCSVIATPSHQHGRSHFVSSGDLLQTQLGGGWTQRKNGAGRIWYHHTRTNTKSFEFPKSAVGQPEIGSGPAKPGNARRATTGGIPSTGPLPPGWEARKTADGRRYYANHSTKQTSWQRPASVSRPRPAGQPRQGSAPAQTQGSNAGPLSHLTPEQRAAQRAMEKKAAERKKLMTTIGTTVLKGAVSGFVKAELRN